ALPLSSWKEKSFRALWRRTTNRNIRVEDGGVRQNWYNTDSDGTVFGSIEYQLCYIYTEL
ncbi:MAG: hypothetical protein K2P23_08380, partial [Lachnospiraceae bacterium]|nr:hypothetical protein [Lachnospiraceae bacterium]